MVDKEKILAGRLAVDAYRTAHLALHSKLWHRGMPKEHTPLLNIMVKTFKGLDFNTTQEFFNAIVLLNLQELGFADMEDFVNRATDADREALRLKWS